MFGMSVVDIFVSAIWTQALKPDENGLACEAEAFTLHFGMIGSSFYYLSLSFYYVLTVYYGKTEEWVTKRVEPYLHSVSILWPLGSGIFLWVTKHFNRTATICWIGPNPPKCLDLDEVECISGQHSYKYRMFFVLENAVIFVLIVTSMIMFCIKIMSRKKKMKKKFKFNLEKSKTKKNDCGKRKEDLTARVINQALIYMAAYFVPTFAGSMFNYVRSSTGKSIFELWITMALFVPIQGFLSSIVFLRPRYMVMRSKYPTVSKWKAFLITTEFKPEPQRARSFYTDNIELKRNRDSLIASRRSDRIQISEDKIECSDKTQNVMNLDRNDTVLVSDCKDDHSASCADDYSQESHDYVESTKQDQIIHEDEHV